MRKRVILALVLVLVPSMAFGAKIWWEEKNFGTLPLLDWGDGNNWVGGSVPGSGDLASTTNAYVKLDDGLSYQVNALSIAGNLGGGYGGDTLLRISNGTLSVVDSGGTSGDGTANGDVRFAHNGNRDGTIELLGSGVLNVGNNITTGSDNSGMLVIDGGTLSMTGGGNITIDQMTVGLDNVASHTQGAGTVTVNTPLALGLNPGSDGTYNLNGGTLRATKVLGGYGSSALNIGAATTLSTDAISGAVLVETVNFGANSSLNLVDPTTPPETYFVGALDNDWDNDANWTHGNPRGVVINNGDTILAVGADTLTGTPTSANPDWTLTPAGNAIMAQYSGTGISTGPTDAIVLYGTAERSGGLHVAGNAGANPDALSLQVESGASLVVNGEVLLGADSNNNGWRGNVDQYGNVTINGDLRFGTVGGSPGNRDGGTYQQFGGTLTVTGDIVETESSIDAAQLHFDGGTMNVSGDITVQRFAVAQNGGTNSTYTIPNGQTVTSTGTTAVGSNGTGVVNIPTGATLDSSNAVVGEGNSSDGEVNITGGTWTGGRISIGNNGPGRLNLTSGTLDVGEMRIADANNGSGQFVMGTADGSTNPTATISGQIETADNAAGSSTFWSGTLTQTNGNFITGQTVGSESTVQVGGGAGTATLDLDGGNGQRDWNTNGGHGVVSVLAGGTVNVGRNLQLGSNADANSGLELTINGGAVNIGTAVPGEINYRNDGPKDYIKVQAGTLNTNGGNVNFADATDRLELTGSGVLDMGGGAIVVTEADGSQFNFNGGRLEHLGLFSDGSGASFTTPDRSGTGAPQDGTLASAEPAGEMNFAALVPGKLGGAIDLDGDNDYVDLGTGTVLGNNQNVDAFSLSMWFNRDVNDTGGGNATNHNVNNVLVAHSRTNGNDHFEVGSEGADLESYVDMDGGNDFTGSLSFAQGVTDDTWHHLVVTFDAARTSDEVHYYLDGQLATKNVGNDPDGLAKSPAELTLGIARIDQNEKWGDLDGMIDDFALWDRVLTDAEVADLYNGGAGARVDSLTDWQNALDVYVPMDELDATAASSVTLVQDGGTLAPGASTGITGIAGDYDFNAGFLEIEIAGDGGIPGVDFDFVNVLGNADLDGTLQALLLGPYQPVQGTTFDVLTAGDITLGGTFALDSTLTGGQWLYNVIPGGNGEILQLTAIVPEPSTLLIWSLLVGLGMGACRRRRR